MKTLCTKVFVQLAEQMNRRCCRRLRIHHQSAIGQSGMRLKHVAPSVGRHQRIEPPVEVEHQRIVLESVGMIIHVATIEEERAVLRPSDKRVPLVLAVRGISDNLEIHFFVITI